MAELKLKILMDAVERVSAPFRRATRSTDDLKKALRGATDTVRDLEKAQANIEAFGRLKTQASANAAALSAAQEKAQAMGRELAAAGGGTKKAQAAFAAARREVNRLQEAQIAITRETATMRTRLGQAGIDTKNLAAAQRQLRRDLDAARTAAARQAGALDQARAKTEGLAKARAKLQGAQEFQGKLAMNGAVGLATGGGMLAAGAPIVGAAGDFEHQLASYGLTAGQSGAALEAVRTKVLALSETVNQSSTNMLGIQGLLVGKGMDPANALASLDVIGRATTATGAAWEDMGNLAFSVMDNLKVPQDQMSKAFDIMDKAGEMGGFELKNMSTYFPQLTASAQQFGMVGTNAVASLGAALQIATKSAADPSEAANNMANFLKAFTAEEAVKNFEEKGIDLKAAMQRGLMAGEDPIETMMKTVGQAVGTDLEKEMVTAVEGGMDPKVAAERLAGRFKLSELFGDAQAQNFLSAMLPNMAKYREIRDAAMGATGTVDEKFAVMMKTYNESTKGLGVSWNNLALTIGTSVLPVMTPLVNGLRSVVQGVSAFAAENPRLTAGLGIAVGAIALLIAAGGALSIALASIIGPFAMVKFAMAAISIQGGIAAGALGMLGTVGSTAMGLLTAGIRAVGMAFLANPIGIAITAIIAGLTALYFAWQPFQDLVDNTFAKIKGIFGFGDKTPPGLTEATEKAKGIAPPPTTMKVASTAAAAALAAPLAAAPAPAAPVNMGGVTIVVNAAPGQSEAEIAKLVRAEIEKLERQRKADARGRLYDGEK